MKKSKVITRDLHQSRTLRCCACIFLSLLLSICSNIGALGQSSSQDTLSPGDLKKRSLEELMQIDITSVSKKSEPLFEAAASVYVITNEDIRRSGARTLPEVLRIAPNLEVAQV